MTQEQKLQKLIALLENNDIPVKSDRGNFKGGLVRYHDSYYFYLNRKLAPEAKINLIRRELERWPEQQPDWSRELRAILG